MTKFAPLAAAAAVALIALPAAAADLRVSREPTQVVRINVEGKTDAQVVTEIKSAAATVCADDIGSCVERSVLNARRQYAAIKRVRDGGASRVEVAREDRTTIRVKVAGRSIDQIHVDIDAAARTVCKAAGADHVSCVDQAARNAKRQLRNMQVASAGQLASR